MKKLNEECAVFGVSLKNGQDAGIITYSGLMALQHRGQDGAGIALVRDGRIIHHKNLGLVSEVFGQREIAGLGFAAVGVGHTRYGTTGGNKQENCGPFVTEFLTGRIATAHNGNVTNASQIRKDLQSLGLCFSATCDSEVVSSLIAYRIVKAKGSLLLGVITAARKMVGAYCLLIATNCGKLIAIRDPNGFRPLCIGKNKHGMAFASESCALDSCGFEFVRDVAPGEVVVIENGEITHEGERLTEKEPNRGLCIFEYVYFARPDSVIDGLNVSEARQNMGSTLAAEHPADADCVVGVPDSGIEAAAGFAAASGLPLVTGFVKNRYIGRSFIYPTQYEREYAVDIKLNPLAANVAGKRIVLVDDSIVRGTTSPKIVKALKNAGAKEVHLRVSSPPFRYSCHYGTDVDTEENLIANQMPIEDIKTKIGVDSLGYISMEGLKAACAKSALPFCTACFTGNDNMKRDRKSIFEG
ncbi:MAG: amidophosphoribosyltransferase [Defluviitaleaceae bacterium]|nr:amidophosphoribosyltransferase [Defluviitaleaceae bacterium]